MSERCIRDAASADVAAIAALEARCFPTAAWSVSQVQQEIQRAGAVAVVLVEDGALVAYALGWSVVDEGELERIAVAPAVRGGGRGSLLLQAFHTASAAVALFLEVRADNHSAQALYRRNGWIKVGLRREYYRDGADALIMRWPAE